MAQKRLNVTTVCFKLKIVNIALPSGVWRLSRAGIVHNQRHSQRCICTWCGEYCSVIKSIFNGYTCILRWVESVFRVVSLVCCRLKIWMLISPRRLWCVVISICSCCVTSFPADCRAFTDSPHDINRSTNAHRNFQRRESSSNAANRDKNDKRLSFHFDWYSSCFLNISWQHLQSWTAFFKTSQVTLLNELI